MAAVEELVAPAEELAKDVSYERVALPDAGVQGRVDLSHCANGVGLEVGQAGGEDFGDDGSGEERTVDIENGQPVLRAGAARAAAHRAAPASRAGAGWTTAAGNHRTLKWE